MKFKLVLFLQTIILISTISLKFAEVKETNMKSIRLSSTSSKCSSNCLRCDNNFCLECPKGNFKYLNGCHLSCPFETIADNYSFSCKLNSNQQMYIKAYTVSRCMNSCGKQFSDCR